MPAENLRPLSRRAYGICAAAILLLALSNPLRGQGKTAVETAPPGRGGFIITPVVSYAPETLIAWGFAGIHYFQFGRSPLPSRLSHYRFNLIYTQKKQTIAQIDYELYLAGGKVMLNGQAKYSLYPDRFYGIGNRSAKESREDFNARNWRLQLNAQRRWGENIFSGLRLEVFTQNVIETETAGLLAAGDIPGSLGMRLSAIGLFSRWDSRDNTFSPSKGAYGAIFLNGFTKLLGSNYDFSQLTIDGRKYFPLGLGSVLSFQGVMKATWGESPFQTLPLVGGVSLLRGFYEGRLRDKCLLALQTEYRLPVVWRIGLCAFAGVAQVQPELGLMSLKGFHGAGGIGVRYKFNSRENLNIRLDVGFAEASPSFYLTFAEAF
jgi:outer membrane protein assembly factor BamA